MDYVIKTGGKQYLVTPNQDLSIEKLDLEPGSEVVFDKVLMTIDGDKVAIGTPYLEGVSLTATIKEHGRDKKKIVFRYHAKTRYHKKKGHRQHFTKITSK